jgi:hypothetical protein
MFPSRIFRPWTRSGLRILSRPNPRLPIVPQGFRQASHFPRPPRGSRIAPEDWHLYRQRNARPLITNDQIGHAFRSPQFKYITIISVGGAIIFYAVNLEEVPVSGRKRFNCYSEASVEKEGQLMFKQILAENGNAILPDWDSRTKMVRRVMNRLIPASGLTDVDWEVYVINSPGITSLLTQTDENL